MVTLLTVRSLGSGSSGNATLIDDGRTALLIDCGIGYPAIERGLAALNRTVDDLAAVVLSHEHGDHIRALPKLLRREVPVLCTAGTGTGARIPAARRQALQIGFSVSIGTVHLTALAVSHDALEPCGFFIESVSGAVSVVTDLGCGDSPLMDPLARSDLIVIEANHDLARLRSGPYPENLKQRVLSRSGHLSNVACGELVRDALHAGTRRPTVWLAHLSATNNTPALAVETVRRILAGAGVAAPVEALPRHSASRLWRSTDPVVYPAHGTQLGLPGFR